MKCVFPLLFASALLMRAQAPTVQNATSPMTVVAVINGKPYTAAEVDAIIQSFPKAQRANFARAPKQFLEEWAQMQSILEHAQKDGIANQSPYKEQLEDIDRQHELMRKQVLYSGELSARANQIPVTSTAMREYYERNGEKYREAKVKLIYLPFTSANEAETRKKAADLLERARSGADFAQLAKDNSEDPSGSRGGDYPAPIRSNTEAFPPEVRQAVLAAKAGAVIGPFAHKGGYYLFKVEQLTATPFDQVKDEIYKELQNAALIRWLQDVRAKTTVTVQNESYFKR